MNEISDIQKLPNGNIEITFCNPPDYNDFMKLIISKDAAWQIAHFCGEKLSYAAELKSKR